MKKCILMVRFVVFLSLTAMFFSCASAVKSNDSFSLQEKESILNGEKNQPMRVLQTTNKADSLLLRTVCTPVNVNPEDKVLQHLIARMYSTVRDSASLGVGIAAPQVGILKRVIWVQRFDKPDKPFEAYINPEIIWFSEQKQSYREGCLSIPNIRGMVEERAYAIELTYFTPQGIKKQEKVEAFTAVIFQHEIDHLNGILFLDYVKS